MDRSKITEVQKRGLAFIGTMDGEMDLVFQRTVLPLFTYNPEHDSTWPEGTGALFRIAGRTFLVSASHVLRAVLPTKPDDTQTIDLYAAVQSSGTLVQIAGNLHGDRSDANDVAVLELLPEVAAALSSVTALTLDDLDLRTGPMPRGWYYVCGWPLDWRRPADVVSENGTKIISGKPFIHSTSLYAGDTVGLRDFGSAHVAVEFDPADTVLSNGLRTATPLGLEGISGCPLWRAFTFGDAKAGWTSQRAKVVAVQTAVYSAGAKTIIRGTRWSVVLSILRMKYPDLEPALRLSRSARG